MALREFTNDDGRLWRVWDILPDQIDVRTRAEDYLQGVLDGWLVFESGDGRDKCRLYPIPARWETKSEDELQLLLRSATPVRGEPPQPSAARGASVPTMPAGPALPSETMRTFKYPGGRYWSVHEWLVEAPEAEGGSAQGRIVLRFASGVRQFDLLAFPRSWEKYTDQQLADLLYVAFPRPSRQPNPTRYARRRGDPQSGTAKG